jgi:CDP-paratose 2-epimerase
MSAPALIIGGAGFIGCNLAARLLSAGRPVNVYDDLSRPGVEGNLHWLRSTFGQLLSVDFGDVRDARLLRRAIRRCSSVFHLAAQTAVTTSVVSPKPDFEINAVGTLTVLEELRQLAAPVPMLFTSTNKVYGNLNQLPLRLNGSRYEPRNAVVLHHGIDEAWPLSFHSPYGCSKGAADQYVLDYSRTYGMPNVVFRMSCIYGPHQCGTEDQGWVAHFALQLLRGLPITVYGDGYQVRDALYVDDLVDAMLLARSNARQVAGRAFNIGGGPKNAISLRELVEILSHLEGSSIPVRYQDWRIGDQRYYVSDTRAFSDATGWRPKTTVRTGVQKLYEWLRSESTQAVAAEACERGVA